MHPVQSLTKKWLRIVRPENLVVVSPPAMKKFPQGMPAGALARWKGELLVGPSESGQQMVNIPPPPTIADPDPILGDWSRTFTMTQREQQVGEIHARVQRELQRAPE